MLMLFLCLSYTHMLFSFRSRFWRWTDDTCLCLCVCMCVQCSRAHCKCTIARLYQHATTQNDEKFFFFRRYFLRNFENWIVHIELFYWRKSSNKQNMDVCEFHSILHAIWKKKISCERHGRMLLRLDSIHACYFFSYSSYSCSPAVATDAGDGDSVLSVADFCFP